MTQKTEAYVGLDPRAKGFVAREVLVTEAHSTDYKHYANLANWLGDQGGVSRGDGKPFRKIKVRVSTRKGVRIAVEGDTIVKVGTRQGGNIPEFFVVKA